MIFQRVATNDITLHVAQDGPEDGPLLILLHGFPEFWYGWRRQIPFFADLGYRVWAPDQRGYNLSDKPQGVGAYRLDTLAQDVVGLIAAAGREKAFVVGHDWGAEVAWWLAMRYPERLERVAMLNVPHPAVMAQELRHNIAQLRKSWYIFFFQLPVLPERFYRRDNFGGGLAALRGSSRRGTFADDDIARYREAWSQPGALTGMINWYRAIIQHPPSIKRDERIAVPTLLIWGAKDRFLGRELAQPSIDRCDDGQLVFIEEASHWVQHEEPDRVNALLRDFFQR